MALTIAAPVTVQNVTRISITGTAGGGTDTKTIFAIPGGTGRGLGGFVERFRIKVVRLIAIASTAGDSIQLKDLGTTFSAARGFEPNSAGTPNVLWESVLGANPFNDQTNLGDEFRNGLQITATSTNAAANMVLYLYHGLS